MCRACGWQGQAKGDRFSTEGFGAPLSTARCNCHVLLTPGGSFFKEMFRILIQVLYLSWLSLAILLAIRHDMPFPATFENRQIPNLF